MINPRPRKSPTVDIRELNNNIAARRGYHLRVTTRNSGYVLSFDESSGMFVATRVANYYKDGHPNLEIGDELRGHRLVLKIGECMELDQLRTTPVDTIKIGWND